jgi:hypothetical protein
LSSRVGCVLKQPVPVQLVIFFPESTMKTKLVAAALLAALSASLAAPAFASGYGPAPFYKPTVGAPTSQRGQSVQTPTREPAVLQGRLLMPKPARKTHSHLI